MLTRTTAPLILGLIAAAAAACPLVAAAAIAPEPTSLATLTVKPSVQVEVAAAAGWTAWSDRQAGQYVLELRSPTGEITTPAAVTPSAVPFRVALGKRSSGQVVAAYDTCPGEKQPKAGAVPPIGSACRISLLDVAAGTVTPVARPARTRSIALPALSGDTLAFVAVPAGKAGRTTARVMTASLSGGAATTRWTARFGKGAGPVQLAVAGKAVAAISSQSGGAAQRLDAQIGPKAKLRTIASASSVDSCCETDALVGVAFAGGAAQVSLLSTSANDEGEASWAVDRLMTRTGKAAGSGPRDAAEGDDAFELSAVSLASDGTRDVVLAADATHPYGVYAFAP